jgi:UDP:flavonoid glycosyltransferase YjiC (YdhE family)
VIRGKVRHDSMGVQVMKILFTVHPGAGHLLPMAPLARELSGRGHDLRVAASPAFAEAVTDAGLVHAPAGLPWLESAADTHFPGFSAAGPLAGLATLFGEPSARLAADVLASRGSWAPDLIVRDNTELGGWAVAHVLGVPDVVFGVIERLPLPAMGAFADQLAALRAAYPELAAADASSTFGDVYLEPAPPALLTVQGIPGQVPTRPAEVGTDGPGAPEWLQQLGDRRVVYLTLGTVFHRQRLLLDILLEALRTEDVDVVLTYGAQGTPTQLPPNVWAAPYIPQGLILPLCSAVLCHAGRGSVLGALAHGVPLVLTPLTADQPVTAAACERAGVARVLATEHMDLPGRTVPITVPERLTVDSVRNAVRAVLDDPSYATAAAAVRAQIATMPAVSETADVVEQLAKGDPRSP